MPLIKDLKEPYKSLAIKRLEEKYRTRYYKDNEEHSEVNDITWSYTIEGHTFWQRIDSGDYPLYNKKLKSIEEVHTLKPGDIASFGWNVYKGTELCNDITRYARNKYNIFVEDSASWLNTHTLLSKSLHDRIQKIECNQDIKDYILSMDYSIDINFVSYDTEQEHITFCPKGKPQHFDNYGRWKKELRQSTTPHKFFMKICKDKFEEYDIKCFADALLSIEMYTVEYVTGTNIGLMYNEIDTEDWSAESCMSGKPEEWFQVYCSPSFRLGVIKYGDQSVGRFLEVTCQDGFLFNDRLYYESERVLAWYNNWVDKNLMTRKYANNIDDKDLFYNKKQGKFEREVRVDIEHSPENIGYMPYMDTLTYGDYEGTVLCNIDDDFDSEWNDTDGKLERKIYCPIDDRRYPEDEMETVGLGVREDEQVHRSNVMWSSANECWILN